MDMALDLRGNVNRAGKLQLEDGEEVEMDLDDMEMFWGRGALRFDVEAPNSRRVSCDRGKESD